MGNTRFAYKSEVYQKMYPVDADTVGDELERIEGRYGRVTASNVVDESRPDEAPLHPVFEWRDAVAAEKYRHEQARELIGSVRATVYVSGREQAGEPVRVKVRAFSNVSPYGNEGVYINTGKAMQNEAFRETVLSNAKREMLQLKRKYETLVDWDTIIKEVFYSEDQG